MPRGQRRTGEPNGRIHARMPVDLHRRLVASAEREGVSLNTYVVATLAAKERFHLPAEEKRA